MATVEPIRSKKKVLEMLRFLKKQHPRDYMLFFFGINTILRITDILKIRYCDIYTEKGQFRRYLTIKETKTGKVKKVKLNNSLKHELNKYVNLFRMKDGDFLFFSLKHPSKPIDRSMAYKILRTAAEKCGIENFGTHTMRKTLAYHVYQETKDIRLVMTMLNHSNPETTLRYIGCAQDAIDEAYMEVKWK